MLLAAIMLILVGLILYFISKRRNKTIDPDVKNNNKNIVTTITKVIELQQIKTENTNPREDCENLPGLPSVRPFNKSERPFNKTQNILTN